MKVWYVVLVLCLGDDCKTLHIDYAKPKTTREECQRAAAKSLRKLKRNDSRAKINWMCVTEEPEVLAVEHEDRSARRVH